MFYVAAFYIRIESGGGCASKISIRYLSLNRAFVLLLKACFISRFFGILTDRKQTFASKFLSIRITPPAHNRFRHPSDPF